MTATFDLGTLHLTEREMQALAGLEWWERNFTVQKILERMPWLLAEQLRTWVSEERTKDIPDLDKISRMEESISKLMNLALATQEERENVVSGIVGGTIKVAGL